MIAIIFKVLRRPLAWVLLVLAVFFILQKINIIPSFGKWFARKPVLIENTPLVVTQIKSIAQLGTVQMYAEVVADSTITTTGGYVNHALRSVGMIPLPLPESKKLVIIVKGKVKAGIDLQKINEGDVFVNADSVRVNMPGAEILEVITNPSDIEIFIETGKWADAESRAVKEGARRRLLEEADRQQLLRQANGRGKLILEEFLRASGFTKINIIPAGSAG